jgi:D-alanine-D-alanine ligase-like ATP-grasp enzyme
MLDFGAAQNWRCIFKLESSSAGLGVRKSADENSFRRVAALMIAQKVPFIVQRFVTGKSNERAAAALNGDVLCGISFEKVQIAYEFGYATVVQPVCNAAMAEFTAVIARSFGLSGFFGCDFVIEEETGRPWLVEVNARPITWHHLAFKCGVDFAEAVHQIIEGRGAPQQDAVIDSRPVALFPKELQRDPQSPWLQKAVHDVPKNHPRLLAYYKERLARESQRKA